ncbi:MAG: hypothetical protein AAF726_15405, partial [Planctomycetota bacterium]
MRLTTIPTAALAASALLTVPTASAAQSCSADWIPSFGSASGTDAYVARTEVVDLGAGSVLVACGAFSRAGGTEVQRIASFDGSAWSPMGGEFEFLTQFRAIATLDAGAGPELYVAGELWLSNGVTAPLARWSGTSWEAAAGVAAGSATSMVSFDDGTGPALYLLGEFDFGGGSTVEGLARFDGSAWTNPLDGVISASSELNFPMALEVFDDGSGTGPALFVGGGNYSYQFASGFTTIRGVSKVTGRDLVPLGTWPGYDLLGNVVALEVFDDGSGAALYVGHTAERIWTGPELGGVQRWDGTSWADVGSQLGDEILVMDLEAFDDGSGESLYVAGRLRPPLGGPLNRIARFDGTTWSAAGNDIDGGPAPLVWSMTSGDLGSGPRLFAGGFFQSAGSVTASHAAQFDGTAWDHVGPAGNSPTDDVLALTTFDDGAGSALYVGGVFDAAGDARSGGIARWDGDRWTSLGQGMTNSAGARSVEAVAVFDDGSGASLYAAGNFDRADGSPVKHIARWDGAAWQAVGGGFDVPQPSAPSLSDPVVKALVVHDDGSGAALYAGGQFAFAGGIAASGIARWDGSVWSTLGSGATTDAFGLVDRVSALAVYDDGVNGPELYAAGSFSSMGGAASTAGIARWDGSAWRALGTGVVGGFAKTLAVVDGPQGQSLWIGGGLRLAPGGPLEMLVEWNGTTLTPVIGAFQGPGGLDSIESITSYDDGTGAGDVVFLGGIPDSSQPQPWRSVWRRDASGWTGIAGGPQDAVQTLHVHNDGAGFGPSLFVGGRFGFLDGVNDAHLARYGGCALGLVGDEYCLSAPNSSGQPGRTRATGSTIVARNELELVAEDLPVGVVG